MRKVECVREGKRREVSNGYVNVMRKELLNMLRCERMAMYQMYLKICIKNSIFQWA